VLDRSRSRSGRLEDADGFGRKFEWKNKKNVLYVHMKIVKLKF
jgi:hypothetical protein